MQFIPTKIADVWLIDLERKEDDRGWFAREWCAEEFQAHGLNPKLVQCSYSFNRTAGTLRGMHFQKAPWEETKVVQCIRGAIYDVALDLRPASVTYKQWIAVELSAENQRMIYIPAGCAHGFQTLSDDTLIFYQMSEFFHPESAAGVRWNDPAFGIIWPDAFPRTMTPKDELYPDLESTDARGVL